MKNNKLGQVLLLIGYAIATIGTVWIILTILLHFINSTPFNMWSLGICAIGYIIMIIGGIINAK